MSDAKGNEFDTSFWYLASEIPNITETAHNLTVLQNHIEPYTEHLLYYVAVIRERQENTIYYANLASLSLWFGKHTFCSVLVQAAPSLLWLREFMGDPVVTTPLDAAIHTRDPENVSFILNMAPLRDFSRRKSQEYESLIRQGLDKALAWYETPHSDHEECILEKLNNELDAIVVG